MNVPAVCNQCVSELEKETQNVCADVDLKH